MKKVVILLGGGLILAGCLQAINVPGEKSYKWTGCHTVEQNPGHDGSKAILPFGFKMPIGGYTFFKQVREDGTLSPITTGKSCN